MLQSILLLFVDGCLDELAYPSAWNLSETVCFPLHRYHQALRLRHFVIALYVVRPGATCQVCYATGRVGIWSVLYIRNEID